MRIRGLTEQRREERRLNNIIEGAKLELKIAKAEIENLSSDIVRLNDPNDDLEGMQKFIEFGD
jgi:hypothetical protein